MRRPRATSAGLGASCLAAMVGSGLALLPRVVEACACCGSRELVEVIGWSSSARAVALRHHIEATCERQEWVEIRAIGAHEPTECYDAYGEDPAASISCNAISSIDPNEPIVRQPGVIPRPAGFDDLATRIDGRYLVAWVWSDEETDLPALDLQVYLPKGQDGRFHAIDLSAHAAALDDYSSPDTITVWPAPSGRDTLLLVGYEVDDDTTVNVVWGTLPRRFDRAVLQREGEVRPVVPDVPPRAPDPEEDEDEDRHHAARLMARARVHERVGDRKRAHALARIAARDSISGFIAYARLTVALGQPERGLAYLLRVGRLRCPACTDELRASLGHADFDPLRAHPAFIRLGGSP